MVHRQQRTVTSCPLCQHHDSEDLLHALCCQSDSSYTHRNDLLQAFELWLPSVHTHHEISSFLVDGLCQWFSDPHVWLTPPHSSNHDMANALVGQQEIGWFALLCGFLSPSPAVAVQHQHYRTLPTKITGDTWAPTRKLIAQELWSLAHSTIWVHRNSALHERL